MSECKYLFYQGVRFILMSRSCHILPLLSLLCFLFLTVLSLKYNGPVFTKKTVVFGNIFLGILHHFLIFHFMEK